MFCLRGLHKIELRYLLKRQLGALLGNPFVRELEVTGQ